MKEKDGDGFIGIIIKILIGLGVVIGLFYLILALTR